MSKVISFQIPKSEKTFIKYQEDRGSYFYNNLHQHPQAQLTLILKGKGQLLVGDYVGRFEPGDLYLLAESIPHVFRSDADYFLGESELQIAGNTLFFDFKIMRTAFSEIEDFIDLIHLNDKITGCFKIIGPIGEKVAGVMTQFNQYSGMTRLQQSIKMLSLLNFSSENLVELTNIPVQKVMTERDGRRMDQVMRYILDNSTKQIGLEEVAEQTHMSKEAFCRFFKLRTRRTFTQYVQQLRVTEAKKLLLETDMSISSISYQVGFQTLSHFNKTFKNLTDMTPKDWRKLE